ncbi:MAG: hypothetical protein IJ846_07310 [Alphaproteobacteria bacterium]|nr:hypothetical protein [Alphaproteobacteria bacterium]
MKLTVLYPFMEDSFSENTLNFIEILSRLKQKRAVDLLITVDKPGRTSDALKKAGLSYEEVAFAAPVGSRDFYLTVLFKLIRSAIFSFFYFKSHQINVMHCPDVLSLLCWGNTSKMNRVPFVTLVQENEKFSRYASLMLADSKKVVCRSEEIRQKLPRRLSFSALLAPEAQNIPENLNKETSLKNTVDFWIELYASLFVKPDLSKITGVLNKN